jgi:hypothetical protein
MSLAAASAHVGDACQHTWATLSAARGIPPGRRAGPIGREKSRVATTAAHKGEGTGLDFIL